MLKPVWRMNKGRGVPSDFESPSKILTRKQYGVSVITNAQTPAETWAWDSFYLRSPVISAYQTNRTKAAKFEQVECDSCDEGTWYISGGYHTKCQQCNGTGRMVRRIT